MVHWVKDLHMIIKDTTLNVIKGKYNFKGNICVEVSGRSLQAQL